MTPIERALLAVTAFRRDDFVDAIIGLRLAPFDQGDTAIELALLAAAAIDAAPNPDELWERLAATALGHLDDEEADA